MSNHKALEMFGRSGNPALNAETFSSSAPDASFAASAPTDDDATGHGQQNGHIAGTGLRLRVLYLVDVFLER